MASKFLRPELVNRITEVVEFVPLGRKELLSVLDILLRERTAAFESEHDLIFQVDAAAKDIVIADGFDPQLGARPLERAVDRLIVQPLVDTVFSGKAKGAEILVTTKDGKIVIVPGAKET